jgi:phosphoribosylformylglycinamidine cyclo-ligase
MARTFNCGIGMVAIVAPNDADGVSLALEGAGETIFEIGRIEEGRRGCTVSSQNAAWNSSGGWCATHHA